MLILVQPVFDCDVGRWDGYRRKLKPRRVKLARIAVWIGEGKHVFFKSSGDTRVRDCDVAKQTLMLCSDKAEPTVQYALALVVGAAELLAIEYWRRLGLDLL